MASVIPTTFTPQRILLIKLRHHGDMILTTPVINALHQHYPQALIDVLLYQETRPILEAHPAIHTLHLIDRKWKKAGLWQQLKHETALIRALRQRHYDMVINLADQWRSALLARFTAAPVRIGFAYNKRRHPLWRFCHTTLIPTDHHPRLHTIEQNLSVLTPLAIPTTNAVLSMHYSPHDWQYTQSLLHQYAINTPLVVIQPTSRWTYKCWDDEKVAALVDQLNQPNRTLILTAGPAKNEMAMIEHILSLCQRPGAISLAGKLSLPQLASLIDHAALFIGVDSAPMHMAAALKTPCIALFGPTKLQQWRPWNKNAIVIQAKDYAPMPNPDTIDTSTQQRYLSAIPVDAVVTAARKLLHE